MTLDRLGIILFWAGAVALLVLVWRRSGKPGARWVDHALLFSGIAGMIAGLALIFLPDFS